MFINTKFLFSVKLKPEEISRAAPVAINKVKGAVVAESRLRISENNPISKRKLKNDDEPNLNISRKLFSGLNNGLSGELFFCSE